MSFEIVFVKQETVLKYIGSTFQPARKFDVLMDRVVYLCYMHV